MIEEKNQCPSCHRQMFTRRAPQRIIGYLFFIASFAAFLIVTSFYKITLLVNVFWFAIQLGFGIWAAIDRMNNSRLVFYCRSCNSRLRS